MDNNHPYGFVAGFSPNLPPLWNGDFNEYPEWKKRMRIFIKSQDIELWKVIVNGDYVIKDEDGVIKKERDYTDEDWKKVQINSKSMHLLLCSLGKSAERYVSSCETAENIWATLETTREIYLIQRSLGK